MELRFCILSFSLLIFVLAAVGTVAFYVRQFVLSFWLKLALLITYPCVFAIFVPLLTGDGKLTAKRILLLTTSITIIAITITNLVWIVITPKWTYSVTTDKSSYKMGEDLKIAVSLRNMGYITHSFKSRISNPVVVSIEYQPTEDPTSTIQVWYSPFESEVTEFSVGPNSSLDRHFIWTQTPTANLWFSEEIKPGIYQIHAFIPHVDSFHVSSNPLFYAETSINITSP